jgi:hypothetical protein
MQLPLCLLPLFVSSNGADKEIGARQRDGKVIYSGSAISFFAFKCSKSIGFITQAAAEINPHSHHREQRFKGQLAM